MTVAYVFQLLSFPQHDMRSGPPQDNVFGSIEVTPPPGCVMLDWRLDRRGDVVIRWRKTPGPGNVTLHTEDLPR